MPSSTSSSESRVPVVDRAFVRAVPAQRWVLAALTIGSAGSVYLKPRSSRSCRVRPGSAAGPNAAVAIGAKRIHVPVAKGHPGNPIDWADMRMKFDGLVGDSLGITELLATSRGRSGVPGRSQPTRSWPGLVVVSHVAHSMNSRIVAERVPDVYVVCSR